MACGGGGGDAASTGAPDAAVVTLPDAVVTLPDAVVALPDAAVAVPDAAVAVPDAAVIVPDAVVALPDAVVVLPDASVVAPDALVVATDALPDALPPPPDAAPLLDAVEFRLFTPIRLIAGERASLPLPALPGGPMVLQLRAEIWRVEDGELRVNGRPALLPGDADAAWVTVTEPWETAPDAPLVLTPEDLGAQIDIEATGGTLVIVGARLADPRVPRPAAPAEAEPMESVAPAPAPCADPGCDDTPALAAALNGAPPGLMRFALRPGTYTLRTPWRITRPDTHLAGDPAGTTFRWDPTVAGEAAALTFAGDAPAGPALPLAGDHIAGTATLRLANPRLGPPPTFVQLVADDFGDVPEICAAGRDVERFQRHIVHTARVLAADADTLTLDRPLAMDVPAPANPRVQAVPLLTGARVTDLTLEAACPEALAVNTIAVEDCTNPEVADDDGLALTRTVGARVERVTARAFGKFSLRVDEALETRLTDNSMDHPSNYGDGGRGYGVHVIRSSRTRILGERVDTCRHAVVVDFGSSDTQLLGADLRNAQLATVDIHGEASRDTLLRGNHIVGGRYAVVVGGGGTEVHCNDGPRHHLHRNVFEGSLLTTVSVTNATRTVTVQDNVFGVAPVALAVSLGAGNVLSRDNRFEGSVAPPILVDATSGPLVLQRNTFVTTCAPEAVVLPDAARPAEAVDLRDDNLYCPDQGAP